MRRSCRTLQWFFFVLAAYKLTAVAGMPFRRRLPYLLPLLAVVLHFASYADAPWPLMRNPVNYRPQSNPMANLEESFRDAPSCLRPHALNAA